MKDITVSFPGGKRVDAHFGGRTVQTDQPVAEGGEGSAAEPFDLFFVSMATCVGIYVLDFCNSRKLPTEGLGVRLRTEKDPDKNLYTPIEIVLTLPAGFPEKYRNAILNTANLCTVKKHLMNPPEIRITLAGAQES